MSQIAYFDPADMMVWFDLNVLIKRFDRKRELHLLEKREVDAAFAIVRGAFDTTSGLSDHVVQILDRFGPAADMSLLTLWHEQRHFLDHLLTNFGASRMRLHWLIRAQLKNIYDIAKRDGVLGVPIDVYADPIECEALGLGQLATAGMANLGEFLADRRNQMARDRQEGKFSFSDVSVDGFCQLEALGSWAQLAGATSFLWGRTLKYFESFETPFTRFPYLEAIVSLMVRCGLKVYDSSRGRSSSFLTINTNLVAPILLAALMCRRTGLSGQDTSSSLLPARRLVQILSQLASDGVREVPNADDGFTAIEKACKKIWARTMVDDLNEDIDFEASQLDKFRGMVSPLEIGFQEQCNSARRRLRDILVSEPSRFCDPQIYATKTIPAVLPKIVLAERSGQFMVFGADENEDFRVLFAEVAGGKSFARSSLCYYCDLKKTNSGVIAGVQFNDSLWINGFEKSRHVRLLTEGRKQAFGAELDAFIAEGELQSAGIALRFRSGHEYPEPERSADLIFELFGTETLWCEISGREITRETAIQLCPWDFQRYPALRNILSKHDKLGICPTDGSFNNNRIGNWSWWLVHSEYSKFLTDE